MRCTPFFIVSDSREKIADLRGRSSLWDKLFAVNFIEVLHALNELRARLTREGAGCVVLCGPLRLAEDAVNEAVDLWSVCSFLRVVQVGVLSIPDLAAGVEIGGCGAGAEAHLYLGESPFLRS
ncbi:hypothetical protein [Actinomyces trachealis]|uniref:hypothetical protein n=1 Tax=Actinomyces trachealis TaxID=2763540 RepID=UPI0018C46D5E|nr:hypothetical protein [Actinomyces trachealis]